MNYKNGSVCRSVKRSAGCTDKRRDSMRRIIHILWGIIVAAILLFVLIVFTTSSDALIWRAFSILMPLIGLSFWGIVMLTVIDFIRSKKQ